MIMGSDSELQNKRNLVFWTFLNKIWKYLDYKKTKEIIKLLTFAFCIRELPVYFEL